MRRKGIIIAGIIVTVIFIFIQISNRSENDRYFKKLNLQLTGVLKEDPDCPNASNGFCILSVDVLQSNISEYDPRDSTDPYYCIIKNKVAEIYQLGGSECKKGDTIRVDTQERIFTCMSRGLRQTTCLYTNNSYREYIREHHQKFKK